jgi:hypothetical protein
MSWRPLTPEQLSVLLEIASAVLAGAVVLFHLAKKTLRGTNAITILARAAGLAILPQALLIMYATFDPTVLCGVQGLRVFYMLSGLSLVYVCVRSVTS